MDVRQSGCVAREFLKHCLPSQLEATMGDLKAIPAMTLNGGAISVHDLLYALKLKGQLQSFMAAALTDYLVAEAARKQGIGVSAEELQKAADAFRLRLGLNRADATAAWLKAKRLSKEDLEAGLERTLLERKVLAREITQEKIQQYFADHRARFDRARLARIVVAKEGLARELLTQIQEEGKDFTELARVHSTDPASKDRGGHIGVMPRKRLPAAVELAVFHAKPGDVVGPFLVGSSYHLLQVKELLSGQLTPRIQQMIGRQLFRTWLREQARESGLQSRLHELV
jgi:putative peptide maturation system protein